MPCCYGNINTKPRSLFVHSFELVIIHLTRDLHTAQFKIHINPGP